MVRTRSQLRRAGHVPVPRVDAIDRMRSSRRWIKRYKDSDRSHRHRLEDSQPKVQQVKAYTRRG